MAAGFVLTYPNIKAWAERLGLPFRYSDEMGQIALRCRIDDVSDELSVLFIPRPERGMLTLALTVPFAVPAARNQAMSEALALLNARSYMGAWILNVDKAELYFRITVPALDVAYSDQSLRFVASVVVSSAEAMVHRLRAIALEGAAADIVTR